MKTFISIIIILFVLMVGCNKPRPEGIPRTFGDFELILPTEFKVSEYQNPIYRAWYLFNNEDSLMILYLKDTANKWEYGNYGFDTKNSISMYDGYLHPTRQESEEFKVSYFNSDEIKGRIVQRNYLVSGKYLDISFKALSDRPVVLQITGNGISENTETTIINSAKVISLKHGI